MIEFAEYYKTYSNVLDIRTVTAEYLIAIKLRSGRQYKSDLSDVLGILAEHEKRGTTISMEKIQKAVVDLYGEWNELPAASQEFLRNAMDRKHFQELYAETVSGEQAIRTDLIRFEQDYPGVLTANNVDAITQKIKRKSDRASILKQLQEEKTEQTEKTSKRKSRSKSDRDS